MFEKLKALWNKPVPIPPEPPKTEAKKERKKKEEQLSPKEIATNNNEPYVAITSVEVDPSNINSGSFELDFNDKFVINLIKAGYKLRETDSDVDIVDRWFQTVCRNIALEVYEQQDADPRNRDADIRVVRSRNIGNGRSEVS